MGKIDDLKLVTKKIWNKQREKKAENPSMNEGEKPLAYGIKKGIIYAILGIFIVAFITSIFFSMDDGNKKPTNMAMKEEMVESNLKPNNNLPNDYEALSQYNQKHNSVNSQNQTSTVRQNPNQQSYQSQQQYRQLENQSMQIRSYQQPYQQYQPGQGYNTPYIQPSSKPQNTEQESPPGELKENLAAAIRFSLHMDETTNEDSNKINATNNATPYNVNNSYVEATNTMLQAGTLIPAIMVSGINSDVAGNAIAQIQNNVYDSLSGHNLLIPAGSRLIGEYSAGASTGQTRLSITWNTLILPNGGSYDIGKNMIAVDGAGYVGLVGHVDNHTSKMLSAGIFSSALGAMAGIASGNTSSKDNYTSGELAAQGAASNLMNSAAALFQKNSNIAPTITIEPGYEFNIFVNSTINFDL